MDGGFNMGADLIDLADVSRPDHHQVDVVRRPALHAKKPGSEGAVEKRRLDACDQAPRSERRGPALTTRISRKDLSAVSQGWHELPGRGDYDLCSVCWWEDEGVDPWGFSGQNGQTLAHAQHEYLSDERPYRQREGKVRTPRKNEARDPDWHPIESSLPRTSLPAYAGK